MEKFQPVYIEWEDSCSDHGWKQPDPSDTINVMDQLTIPNSCIKKYKKIKL